MTKKTVMETIKLVLNGLKEHHSYRQIEKGAAIPILNMTLYALSRIFAEERSAIRGENELYETYLA